ncbi:hypothetical protein [Nocardia wallacei]|uniref:hypothetical protein n=1 Tax=Nocardia wallacei TaxID=480035 RepID=UPI002457F865|nr:hypothetical protein [Nocardia wallacei]
MTAPKPGDVRLWRMRKHLGEWTLRCDNLAEAAEIAHQVNEVEERYPDTDLVTVQWFTSEGWVDVPEADLEAARRAEQ